MPMDTSSSPSTIMNSTNVPVLGLAAWRSSSSGIRFIKMAAAAVPPTINGMRRPMRVLVLSDSAPKNGSKNSASTLSAAIMAPAKVSFSLKVSVRIKVITLSYICQNVQIDKNARPTRMVRRLFSFTAILLTLGRSWLL